jgi:hypothetical protein
MEEPPFRQVSALAAFSRQSVKQPPPEEGDSLSSRWESVESGLPDHPPPPKRWILLQFAESRGGSTSRNSPILPKKNPVTTVRGSLNLFLHYLGRTFPKEDAT